MEAHNQKVQYISSAIKDFKKRNQPFRLYHGSTGRTNTVQLDRKKVIDTSGLKNVLAVDTVNMIAHCEPNVNMEALVTATLKKNLVPLIVTELSTLTVGGGFAGMAGECSSFKFGPFDAICTEIELVTGDGEIRICSQREDQYPDLFEGAKGSSGTLGVLTLVKVKLMPAKKYVEYTLRHAGSFESLREITLEAAKDHEGTDFVETVLLAANEGLLMTGILVDEPKDPATVFKCWNPEDPWFYHGIKERSAELSRAGKDATRVMTIPLVHYLFRHDRGAFWGGDLCLAYFCLPNVAPVRRIFDSCLRSGPMYHGLHRSGLAQKYIIQDLLFSDSNVISFLRDFDKQWNMYPISFCPSVKGTQALVNPNHGMMDENHRSREVIWNVGTYGERKYPELSVEQENRKLVDLLRYHKGIKWTYCESWMSEEEFREDYDVARVEKLRAKYDSEWLPSIYDKIKTDKVAIEKAFSGYGGFWNIWPTAAAYGGISAMIGRDYLFTKEPLWSRLFGAWGQEKRHSE